MIRIEKDLLKKHERYSTALLTKEEDDKSENKS